MATETGTLRRQEILGGNLCRLDRGWVASRDLYLMAPYEWMEVRFTVEQCLGSYAKEERLPRRFELRRELQYGSVAVRKHQTRGRFDPIFVSNWPGLFIRVGLFQQKDKATTLIFCSA